MGPYRPTAGQVGSARILLPAACGIMLVALLAAVALAAVGAARAPARPGDLNCDGRVNLLDIAPFVLALADPAEWQRRYHRDWNDLLLRADFNHDSQVDTGDIDGFCEALRAREREIAPMQVETPGGGQRDVGTVDLDIDSDFNNGTGWPDRSSYEDFIEDFVGIPGKFVLVNNDDDDRSGVPDKDQAGAIPEEQDDLVPLILEIEPPVTVPVPDEFTYRVTFPTNVRLWKSPARGVSGTDDVPSGTAQEHLVWLLGDMNGDGTLDFGDINPFILALSDPAAYAQQFPGIDPNVAGDMDGNGVLDFGDINPFVEAQSTHARWFSPARLWVEGLSPSAYVGDTRFVAEADTDKNGTFDATNAVRATIVSLTGSPTSGPLGTAINLSLVPAVAPVVFTADTTATWSGIYHPNGMAETQPFAVEFNSDSVHDSGPGNGALVVGEGQVSSGDPGRPGLDGVLDGDVTLWFNGIGLRRTLAFAVEGTFTYVSGVGGAGDEVDEVLILDPCDPSWGEALTLETAVAGHVLLTVLAEKNAYTPVLAPMALRVELVSHDSLGTEIDRLPLVVFLEQQREDFGPTRLVYYSDWEKPIVFVSSPVDPDLHPTLTILQVDPSGNVFPVFGQ